MFYEYVGPVVYSGFNTENHPAEKTDIYKVLGEGAFSTGAFVALGCGCVVDSAGGVTCNCVVGVGSDVYIWKCKEILWYENFFLKACVEKDSIL